MTQNNWAILGAIGGLLSAAVTAVGLFLVVLQIRGARRIAAADFLFRLQNEFSDHLEATYQKVLSGGPWAIDKTGPSNPAEVAEMENYLDFFETLQVLRVQGQLPLETIDRMFAFRFFVMVNNPHAHRVIELNKPYWDLLYRLYTDWVEFRKKRKKVIPQEEYYLA